jgi:threonine/homoserine/homoserine lactone efflux protein
MIILVAVGWLALGVTAAAWARRRLNRIYPKRLNWADRLTLVYLVVAGPCGLLGVSLVAMSRGPVR